MARVATLSLDAQAVGGDGPELVSQPVGRHSPTRSEPFLSDERRPLNKNANQKGPHWTDPLKAWGDVLAKRDHTKETLFK